MKKNLILNILTLSAICISTSLDALSGVYHEGYGLKARGMAGVGIALPQDSLVGAMNPAGMVRVGNRFDVSLTWASNCLAKCKFFDNANPANNGRFFAQPDVFIPEFGFNKMITPNISLGLSAWARGASYSWGAKFPLYGTSNVGSEDVILTATPSMAWQINDIHSIGFGVDLVACKLKIKGFQNFASNSIAPQHVTNKGSDYRPGIGFHVGWMGKFTNNFTMGLSYQSPSWVHRFNKYKGLFPDKGSVNLPANYGIGFAYTWNCWQFGLDVIRFLWSNQRALGNSFTLQHPNGSKHGTGFGWRDQTTFRLGAAYQFNESLILRCGYRHSNEQVRKSQLFNCGHTPLLTTDTISLGASCQWDCNELDIFYSYDFVKKLKNKRAIPTEFGGGGVKLDWNVGLLGLQYGRKF